MRLNKYLTMAAVALTLGFASCSSDDEAPQTGGTEGTGAPTKVSFTISQAATPGTYAPTGTVPPTTPEKTFSGNVKIVVFNSSNNLEKVFDVSGVTPGTPKTTALDITAGSKRIYAFLNTPAAVTVPTTLGMTRAAFEMALQTVTVADIATANQFFMCNINTPAAVVLDAGVVNPEAEVKNLVTIKVGRAAAKISLTFNNPTYDLNAGGTLSNVNYRMYNIAKKMYLIGQYNGVGQVLSPLFDVSSGGNTTVNLADYTADVAYKLLTDTTFAVENSNYVPLHENTTGMYIKAKFTPTAWKNANGTAGAASGDGSIWVGYNATNEIVGYYNAASPTEAGIVTVKYYPQGICYYRVWITDNTETVPAKKYNVIRNYFYRVTVASVSGIGDTTEPPLDPGTEVEPATKMVATIDILPWSLVEQSVGL